MICGRKERGREHAGNHAHQRCVHSLCFEPSSIILKVLPNGCHHTRPLTEQRHCVGDIGCNTATLFGHGINEERQADRSQTFGKDLFLEMTREGHQVIICNGAREKNIHATSVTVRPRDDAISQYHMRLHRRAFSPPRNDMYIRRKRRGAWWLSRAKPVSKPGATPISAAKVYHVTTVLSRI